MPDRTTHLASPCVCQMHALVAAPRAPPLAAALHVCRAVPTRQELPNGYAFGLPHDPTLLRQAVECMAHDRLGCPCLGFAVESAPAGGPLWWRLTGRDGVKPCIRAESGTARNETVAHAATLR
jgi:hypothetical protein